MIKCTLNISTSQPVENAEYTQNDEPSRRKDFEAESAIQVVRRFHSAQTEVILHYGHDIFTAFAIDKLIVDYDKPSPTEQFTESMQLFAEKNNLQINNATQTDKAS